MCAPECTRMPWRFHRWRARLYVHQVFRRESKTEPRLLTRASSKRNSVAVSRGLDLANVLFRERLESGLRDHERMTSTPALLFRRRHSRRNSTFLEQGADWVRGNAGAVFVLERA